MRQSSYPTIFFRLDKAAFAALGLTAERKGLSPNAFAKAALCHALSGELRTLAAETEAMASARADRAAVEPSSDLLEAA